MQHEWIAQPFKRHGAGSKICIHCGLEKITRYASTRRGYLAIRTVWLFEGSYYSGSTPPCIRLGKATERRVRVRKPPVVGLSIKENRQRKAGLSL